jgi:hypothetical protein
VFHTEYSSTDYGTFVKFGFNGSLKTIKTLDVR